MRFSESEINELRDKADIVEVISHYIPVTKQGKGYVAVCPFHDDHSPSLSISVDKQIYRCFACQHGGNVFTFVSDYEHISFVESVVKVAEIVSFPLSITPSLEIKESPKAKYYKLLNEMIKYTMYALKTPSYSEILSYCTKRGFNQDVIDTFRIGYNGSNDEVLNFLVKKGYSESDCIDVNIARMNDYGLHDVFYQRLLFPIWDAQGNPIAFTARSLDSNTSKYINTSETLLYTKGKVVYNYHRAKAMARKENKVYITEGVIDVIAFYQLGLLNAVATLGTACTIEQLQLIKQCCNTVVFCYDGDTAGQNATFKAAEMANKLGMVVSIVQNDTGLDPDELLRQHGKEALSQVINKEITWLEFVFNTYLKRTNLDNYSEKKEFAEKCLIEIEKWHDDFDKQNFLHQLQSITGFKIQLKSTQTNTINHVAKKPKATLKISSKTGRLSAEELICSQMLHSNVAVDIFKNELGFLIDKEYQAIAMMIIDEYRKYNDVKLSSLLDMFQEQSVKLKVLDLEGNELLPKEFDENVIRGAISRVKQWMLEEKINQLKSKLQSPLLVDKASIIDEYQTSLLQLRKLLEEMN